MKSGIALSAKSLRVILFVCMFLLFIAGASAITYGFQQIRAFNREVNTLEANASISNDDVVKLQQLKQSLADNSSVILKTHRIVAESMSYRYQDEIIDDLTKYASTAGINIAGFSFTSAASPSTTTPTPAPAGATPAAPSTATPSSSLPSGVKSTSVTVSLESPVDYKKFMNFVQLVETNATKMQIKSISIAKPTGTNAGTGDIEPQDLQIEVYIR